MSALLRFAPENGATCLKIVASYEVADVGVMDALFTLTRRPRGRSRVERDFRRLSEALATAQEEEQRKSELADAARV